MKRVDLTAYGIPEQMAHCVDVDDAGALGDGEVVFDVLAFPINPADIWFCRGNYRVTPKLPATPGAECVGRVSAVGAGVTHVAPGDLVIDPQRENWGQRRRVRGDDVIRLPDGINVRQAAMVRSAACLAEESTGCNYGSITGEDPLMPRSELLFRGITLTGFVLDRLLGRRTQGEIRAIYADLGGQIKAGTLDAPIAKTSPIEEIRTALAHAEKGARGGKTLIAPNGMV